MSSELLQRISHRLRALDIKQTPRTLRISLANQSLALLRQDGPAQSFLVSTGRKPPSCQEGSGGTPHGLHRIARKIGDGARLGEVFKGRRSIGKTYEELPPEKRARNLVTTRILWLAGLEPGLNAGPGRDSYERYIYIHGTNREDKIGQPASGGCIQLRNREMVALYDAVEVGDLVLIEDA